MHAVSRLWASVPAAAATALAAAALAFMPAPATAQTGSWCADRFNVFPVPDDWEFEYDAQDGCYLVSGARIRREQTPPLVGSTTRANSFTIEGRRHHMAIRPELDVAQAEPPVTSPSPGWTVDRRQLPLHNGAAVLREATYEEYRCVDESGALRESRTPTAVIREYRATVSLRWPDFSTPSNGLLLRAHQALIVPADGRPPRHAKGGCAGPPAPAIGTQPRTRSSMWSPTFTCGPYDRGPSGASISETPQHLRPTRRWQVRLIVAGSGLVFAGAAGEIRRAPVTAGEPPGRAHRFGFYGIGGTVGYALPGASPTRWVSSETDRRVSERDSDGTPCRLTSVGGGTWWFCGVALPIDDQPIPPLGYSLAWISFERLGVHGVDVSGSSRDSGVSAFSTIGECVVDLDGPDCGYE